MTSVRGFSLVLACACLGACGNASESIEVSSWQQVGTRQEPTTDMTGMVTTSLAAGTGRAVAAGDLVKLRLVVARECKGPGEEFIGRSAPEEIWLWTGREPSPQRPDQNEFQDRLRWGDLGSPRFRTTLIGRYVGEKLRIQRAKPVHFESIPLRGFSLFEIEHVATLFQRRDETRWPWWEVASSTVWSEVEILAACEGSLHRRTATISQTGSVTSMFGQRHFSSERQDKIRWSALEGKCEAGEPAVRLEIGPMYFVHITQWQPTNLYQWSASYRRLRPPDKFPEEYNVATIPRREQRFCDRAELSIGAVSREPSSSAGVLEAGPERLLAWRERAARFSSEQRKRAFGSDLDMLATVVALREYGGDQVWRLRNAVERRTLKSMLGEAYDIPRTVGAAIDAEASPREKIVPLRLRVASTVTVQAAPAGASSDAAAEQQKPLQLRFRWLARNGTRVGMDSFNILLSEWTGVRGDDLILGCKREDQAPIPAGSSSIVLCEPRNSGGLSPQAYAIMQDNAMVEPRPAGLVTVAGSEAQISRHHMSFGKLERDAAVRGGVSDVLPRTK